MTLISNVTACSDQMPLIADGIQLSSELCGHISKNCRLLRMKKLFSGISIFSAFAGHVIWFPLRTALRNITPDSKVFNCMFAFWCISGEDN